LIIVAILFGAIKNGGESLSTSMGIPKDIIAAMRGLIILFASAPMVLSYLGRRIHKQRKVVNDNEQTVVEKDSKKEDKL